MPNQIVLAWEVDVTNSTLGPAGAATLLGAVPLYSDPETDPVLGQLLGLTVASDVSSTPGGGLAKRTLTNLYNERPAWLDLAHKKLDAAVAAAYGWPADLSDDQILEKLLALNQERAAEEAKAAKTKTPRAAREKSAEEMI